VRANLQLVIEESHAVIVSDELPRVLADPTQMTQLFQNLVGNAIKFHGKKEPRVHITSSETDQEWIISVSDNGIGIDPQYFERIFIIFQRLHTRTEYPGTGIGLAISRRILDRHNGRIWVESKTGEGTTFHFALPKVQKEQKQESKPEGEGETT
jgi:chemotaxis family two-component system sensor kinase Cph1